VTFDPKSGQGEDQEPKTSQESSPQRDGAVIQRLIGTSGEPATVIPAQVYDMIIEIVNFTYEVEGRAGPHHPPQP